MTGHVLFEHTDKHGDTIRVVRPEAGGYTVQVGVPRHGAWRAVWLDPATAAALAVILTGDGGLFPEPEPQPKRLVEQPAQDTARPIHDLEVAGERL